MTMNTYIMLLRGINVGGRNILPMKELKSLLESKGYENVKTYIQSGNVLVDANEQPDDSVRAAIKSKFGFDPNIMIFEQSEFETLVRKNPYSSDVGKSIHFFYCEREPKPDREKIELLVSATERFELIGNVFYLFAPDGIGRSKLAGRVEALLGVPATARNLNTVNKIINMAEKA
jgi:uncharacterized protein (DUF1697 family)